MKLELDVRILKDLIRGHFRFKMLDCEDTLLLINGNYKFTLSYNSTGSTKLNIEITED